MHTPSLWSFKGAAEVHHSQCSAHNWVLELYSWKLNVPFQVSLFKKIFMRTKNYFRNFTNLTNTTLPTMSFRAPSIVVAPTATITHRTALPGRCIVVKHIAGCTTKTTSSIIAIATARRITWSKKLFWYSIMKEKKKITSLRGLPAHLSLLRRCPWPPPTAISTINKIVNIIGNFILLMVSFAFSFQLFSVQLQNWLSIKII